MKFLLANTIVSDGPVVNDVDRRIIIGGKYLEHELAMKTAGCKHIESPCAVQSECQWTGSIRDRQGRQMKSPVL